MILHTDPRTPSARRVDIFLAEKGIEIPRKLLDIEARDHRRPEHLARNPLGQVPVLELDDGTCMAESMAICRYFEALCPRPSLFGRPDDPRDLALVEMWNRRIELNLLLPVFHVFRHGHPAMKALEVPQVPAWAEANRPRIARMLALLDRELQGRAYMAGEAFTVADITAFVAIRFMRVLRWRVEEEAGLDHLKAWLARMKARPSVREEGLAGAGGRKA